MASIYDKLKTAIKQLPAGSVFTITDFEHLASNKTLSKFFERLCDSDFIRKLARGVFWIPSSQESPEPVKVAYAIARANDWKIAPCGESAKYVYGASEKAPSEWTFVTNGTYRSYSIGNILIRFTHTTGKMLASLSDKSALLVQVIKAYGRNHLPEWMQNIWHRYTKSERKNIITETKNVTSWISEEIIRFLGAEQADKK